MQSATKKEGSFICEKLAFLRYPILLVILFIPALGGSNAQVVKLTFIAAAGCVFSWWIRTPLNQEGLKVFFLGVIFLLVSLVSTAFSSSRMVETVYGLVGYSGIQPVYGLVGYPERVEGWFSFVAVFTFAWLAFWSGKENEPRWYAITLLILTLVIVALWPWKIWSAVQHWSATKSRLIARDWSVVGDWSIIMRTVASKLGIATMLAQSLPMILAWAWLRKDSSKLAKGLSLVVTGLALVIIMKSGCRSAALGFVLALIILAVLGMRRFPWHVYGLAGIAMMGVILLSPHIRQRILDIHPSAFGHGVRAEAVKQIGTHGVPLLGFGLESQRALIDETILHSPDHSGIYDRYHFWPADILVTSGWVGLALVLAALWYLGKSAWQNRGPWYVAGFAGTVVVFLTSSTWNPQSTQNQIIAAIAAAGLCVYCRLPVLSLKAQTTSKEKEVSFLNFAAYISKPLVKITCLVAFLVYGACMIGDQLNETAKRQWVERSALPHIIAAKQSLATKLNPWVYRDYVMTYCMMCQSGELLEPMGGKVFLKQLFRDHPDEYYLQYLLWLGFGDQAMANKALENLNRTKN